MRLGEIGVRLPEDFLNAYHPRIGIHIVREALVSGTLIMASDLPVLNSKFITPNSQLPTSFECRVRDVEGGEAGSRNGNGAAQDGEPRSKPDRREAAGTPFLQERFFCFCDSGLKWTLGDWAVRTGTKKLPRESGSVSKNSPFDGLEHEPGEIDFVSDAPVETTDIIFIAVFAAFHEFGRPLVFHV